jgi:large subunit ribosomal protein L9
MKLLLMEDVKNLGNKGEEVDVTDGYGRNYLVPKGLAILLAPQNIKSLSHQRKLLQDKLNKTKKEAGILAEQIKEISCILGRKVGEKDRLFGSVTSLDIAEYLQERGFAIDKRKILLEDSIKSLGVYSVPVKLHPDVTVEIKVEVVKE